MSLKSQLVFIKKLESFYRSGTPTLEIFNSLVGSEPGIGRRQSYNLIIEEIKNGSSLAAALEKEGELLDPVYIRLIHVGERSGKLDSVLKHIIELITSIIDVRRKTIAVSIYPAAILITYLLVFSILFFGVVPAMASFMLQYNMTPPLIMLAFLGVKKMLFSPLGCCMVPISIALVGVFFYIYLNLDVIAMLRSRFLLLIPGFGHLEKYNNMFAYIYTMKICYESGLSPLESTELSAHNVSNHYLFDKFAKVYEYVNNGDDISTAFRKSELFDFTMVDFVKVGEGSGRLDESYTEILRMLDEKMKVTIAIMIGMVKPLGILLGLIFLLGIFGMLGLVLFSVFKKL
jgi:type II secretory pathway component PulF